MLKVITYQEALSRKDNPMNEWNFSIGEISLSDKILFFSWKENERFECLFGDVDMWDILVKTGVFANRSAAKGAGIDRKIPEGFISFVIGKKKSWITIFNEVK